MHPCLTETKANADGVHYVELEAGSCQLYGYWGPRGAVTAYAHEDGIFIVAGDGLAAVLVNVLTLAIEGRRQGLATNVVQCFLDHLRSRSVAVVYLRAALQDEAWDIVRWYERLGFQRSPGAIGNEPQMFLKLLNPGTVVPGK